MKRFKLFVLMCIVAIVTTSCASNSKKHGLVQRGCGGLDNLPKIRR